MSQTVPPSTSPESDRDVPCPLCDYNLRGIDGARCPECGHAFNRAELLAGRQTVRWLYEHRRGLALPAAFGTLARSLRPATFWTRVRPTQDVRPARLALYLLILTAAAAVASWSPLFIRGMLREHARLPAIRQQFQAQLIDPSTGRPWPGAQAQLTAGGFSSVEDYLDHIVPSPTLSALWYAGSTWRPMERSLAAIVAWPVLTTLLLVAFRKARGRPDVRPEHLWRVAVYSVDVLLILWALLLPAGWALAGVVRWTETAFPPLFDIVGGRRAGAGANVLLLALLLLAAARFAAGYRLYLGWSHAWRTVLLIQCFVLLAVMQLMIVVNRAAGS